MTYIYSYANSDAWGLSMATALFLLVAVMIDESPVSWTWGQCIALGALTGLILVSKRNYLLSLVLPYSLLGLRLWQTVSQTGVRVPQRSFRRLVLGVLVAAAIAAPLGVIYPLTQGDFAGGVEQM